ncbi:hypothetical protein E2P86_02635 [Sphingobacterium psychroaquaticum]|uniref:hypothetical protein n=1 Tax=Sphingobacterium psychroaquaticum TaxID=561061 RepID=UPI00106D2974|nr:hypothetical protein [Sphingobacterium psychroaquaticum]QBQ40107.1 hypothetical protein E2P86_02635 [Sphingobacterium psychroaquaticum]
MKKLNLVIILSCALLSCTYAQEKNIVQKNTKEQANEDKNWQLINNNKEWKLRVRGQVQLRSDDKAITSLSRGGAIHFSQRGEKLEVSEDKSGNVLYKINGRIIDENNTTYQSLISSCVSTLIKGGVDAERRTARLYTAGGTQAVLQELGSLHNDFARSRYINALLLLPISSSESVTLIKQVPQLLESDYYQSEIFSDLLTKSEQQDYLYTAILSATEDIKSDYYRYTTVSKLLNVQSLNQEQKAAVLHIVRHTSSDYYQAELFKQLLKTQTIESPDFQETMSLVQSMKSDYYKTEILSGLMKKAEKESDWKLLIPQVSHIASDYYQAELLQQMTKRIPASETLKQQLQEAAKNIKSDFYYGKITRQISAI